MLLTARDPMTTYSGIARISPLPAIVRRWAFMPRRLLHRSTAPATLQPIHNNFGASAANSLELRTSRFHNPVIQFLGDVPNRPGFANCNRRATQHRTSGPLSK
jgi:hypothetical protein